MVPPESRDSRSKELDRIYRTEEEQQRARVSVPCEIVERYNSLKCLVERIFSDSNVARTGWVSSADVPLAREFLIRGARETNPTVWASFFEHAIIAPELGRLVAEQAATAGLEVDPRWVEFALWPHDISRLVSVDYLRNDFIGKRLSSKIERLGSVFDRGLSSTYDLMKTAVELKLTDGQIKLEEELNAWQDVIVEEYFNSLTPEQRITNLADNLGKRDKGGIFTLEAFRQYLKSQERRYDQTSPWPSVNWAISSPAPGASPRRPDGAALQYYTVKKTIEWLEGLGVDLNGIFNDLADYGPKFVVVVRHGEIANSMGIVYNRDEVMKPDEIIHIDSRGKEQMTEVAKMLLTRRFNIVGLFSSPETRAMESTESVKAALGSALEIKTKIGLDDAFCPGPYFERMTMKNFMEIGGNVYDNRWQNYNHETASGIKERINNVFWQIANNLRTGEAGVMVSHGDPIAYLLNALDGRDVAPENLRKANYPKKGEAVVLVLDPKGELFTMYSLNALQLKGSQIY